ncbi:hypothetical protein HHI36_008216 [Cryptolaemus montrouzieri]|uniref:Uncharacterized protein n=1 Tax=Cryptolaemus montrouzieri TaxID=559131 RepID=A0ABD2MSD5_9CUCU
MDEDMPLTVTQDHGDKPENYEYFSDLFSGEAAEYSTLYAVSKTEKELKTKCNKILKVFGIHLPITYHRIRIYWNLNHKFKNVYEIMKRGRFFDLRLKLKIECTIGMFSIDGQMMDFTFRCTLKHYLSNKLRPVGLKRFALFSSAGVMLNFYILRKSTDFGDYKEFGIGPAVISKLI